LPRSLFSVVLSFPTRNFALTCFVLRRVFRSLFSCFIARLSSYFLTTFYFLSAFHSFSPLRLSFLVA
jgi:hypothetical protein